MRKSLRNIRIRLSSILLILFIFNSSVITGQNPLYYGQVPIEIPLHQVNEGSISIPIKLEYNGMGVKPNKHTDWTGLNWKLSGMGYVSREVKGLPDDFIFHSLMFQPVQAQPAQNFNEYAGRALNGNPLTGPWFKDQINIAIDAEFPTKLGAYTNTWDREPDKFTFNLPDGTNGEFYFKQISNGVDEWIIKGNKKFKIRLLKSDQGFFYMECPEQGIAQEVTHLKQKVGNMNRVIITNGVNNNGFNHYRNSTCFIGFEITTDDGTIYTFGNGDAKSMEISKPFFQQHISHWQVDAWYLVNIKSVVGDIINFTYDDSILPEVLAKNTKATKYINRMTRQLSDVKVYDCEIKNDCNSVEIPKVDTTRQEGGVYEGLLIKPVYLKEIETRTEKISFVRKPSVELEYTSEVYSQFYKYFVENFNFKIYYPNGVTSEPSQSINWCPHLNKITPSGYPDINPETMGSYIIDNWIRNLTAYKLSEIIIYSKKEAKNIYNYKLNFNNDDVIYNGGLPSTTAKRLTLNSVDRVAGGKYHTYKFAYNQLNQMPNKYLDTRGLVDHWGFFNNKQFDIEKKNELLYWNFNGYFSSREPTENPLIALEGSLKSITFPNGGRIEYTFEQNRHKWGYGTYMINLDEDGNRVTGGLRISQVSEVGENDEVKNTTLYKYIYNYRMSNDLKISSGQRDLRYEYYLSFNKVRGTVYNYEDKNKNSNTFKNVRGRILNIGVELETPPVCYSEVTVEKPDGSFTKTKFTNFFNEDGSSWIEDEEVPSNERTQPRVTLYQSLQEPLNSRSFERGLDVSEENYSATNLMTSKTEKKYDDITNRNTDYTYAISTQKYAVDANSSTNWTAFAMKALISFVPYAGEIDFVLNLFGVNWLPAINNTKIISLNFGYGYKVYTNLYGLVQRKTYKYDINGTDKTKYILQTQDLKYNVYSNYGNLNEVITTLPTDKVNDTDFKSVELIKKNKYSSDYLPLASCQTYILGVYNTCISNGGSIESCKTQMEAARLQCAENPDPTTKSILTMQAKNMLSIPIEALTLKNVKLGSSGSIRTTVAGGSLKFYRNFNLNSGQVPLLYEAYSLRTLPEQTNFQVSIFKDKSTFTFNSGYDKLDLRVTEYDLNGNPTKFMDGNGVENTIMYDSYSRPIARSNQNAPSIGGKQVGSVSLSYLHLRGPESIIDANSKSLKYTYDDFGRVKTIKDGDSYVLKSYSYNLPFSSPNDLSKRDIAASTELGIDDFSKLEECKPDLSPCELDSKIKAFDSAINCINGTVTLQPDNTVTSAGTGVQYLWTGPNKFTSTSQSPTINGDLSLVSGVYTLKVTKEGCNSTATSTAEIIVNCGCSFALSTNGSTSSASCTTDLGATINLVGLCEGCSGELLNNQLLNVSNGKFDDGANVGYSTEYYSFMVKDPTEMGGVFRSFKDHTSGTGNMLMLGHSEDPNLKLYSITIQNVKPNTRYLISGWAAAATDYNPNILYFDIDGNKMSEQIGFSTGIGGEWKQLKSYYITEANQTSITISIRKQSTTGWNWICLDDITFTEAPKAEYSWVGPQGFNINQASYNIRNAVAKNSGDYFFSVKDKNCFRTEKLKVSINCPTCEKNLDLFASSNTPVSANGVIKLKAQAIEGTTLTWFGKNITNEIKNIRNPEIKNTWFVKEGGETQRYVLLGYLNGCADTAYTDVKIIKNIIPTGRLGADIAFRLRREDGKKTIESGETARFCADINNAGPNSVFSLRYRISIPECLEIVGLSPDGRSSTISGPEYDFTNKQQSWFNSTTRTLWNLCTSAPNETPPFTAVTNCWQYNGAEMGGDWSWNNWNTPVADDLKNFSTHTFTKSVCFDLKASQKTKFVIKGEVLSSDAYGNQEVVDPDSYPGDGYDNGQDDWDALTLNSSFDTLIVSKGLILVGNNSVPNQVVSISTLKSAWTASLVGVNTSWLTITPSSGSSSNGTLKTTNISIAISNNLSQLSRYAVILIKSDCGEEQKILVKQAGAVDCPSGLSAKATTPVFCGESIQLNSFVKPIDEANLIVNGDFELGNVGFSSESWSYYDGTTDRSYVVEQQPKTTMWFINSNCTGVGDNISGSGKMMGLSASYVKNVAFWSQEVSIDKGTDYSLSLKATQLGNYDSVPVEIEFYVNNMPTGIRGTISTVGCTWNKISGTWYSGELLGPVKLSIRVFNYNGGIKYIGIDDIKLTLAKNGRLSETAMTSYKWVGPLADLSKMKPASNFTSSVQNPVITNAGYKNSGTYTVQATRNGCTVSTDVVVDVTCPTNVCTIPTISMNPINGTICGNLNQTVTLTASGCNGTIFWTDLPNGIGSNPRVISGLGVGSYTYTARCVTDCGMSSESVPVIIKVKGIPQAPILSKSGTVIICPGSSTILNATGCENGSLTWKSSITGTTTYTGASLEVKDGIHTNPSTGATISVTCTDACGISSASSVIVKVQNILATVTPIATLDRNRFCIGGGTVQLSASGCPDGSDYKWYKVNGDGTLVLTNPLVVVSTSSNFKVRCESKTCVSNFSSTLNVNVRTDKPATPSMPTVAGGQSTTVCQGTTLTLNSGGCVGSDNHIVWSTGQSSVNSITWSNPLAGTYYINVKCVSDIGCESDNSTNLIITVPQGPAAPTGPCPNNSIDCNSGTICNGESIMIWGGECLSGQTSAWFSSTDNVNFNRMIGFTSKNITVAPSVTTLYKVACQDNCSIGAFASKTVIIYVKAKPNKIKIVEPAVSMSSPACNGVTLRAEKIACDGLNNSFKWYKDGVAINNANDYNFNAMVSGTYKVSCVQNDNPVNCQESDQSDGIYIMIENIPPTPVIESIVSTCGGTTLTSSNCGQNLKYKWYLLDTEIALTTNRDFKIESAGRYSVACVNEANSTCKRGNRSDMVDAELKIVPPTPTISLASGYNANAICKNTPITLSAVGCPDGGTVKWSNGRVGNTITYEALATEIVSATCSNGVCTSTKSSEITLTVRDLPSKPNLSASVNVCVGQDVTLTTSNCTGGTVSWSNGSNGVSQTFRVYNTTDIFAVCKDNYCASEKSTINITASDPGTPVISASKTDVTRGTAVRLTVNGCSAGSNILWSTGSTSTFIDPVINTTTTFKVQCIKNGCSKTDTIRINELCSLALDATGGAQGYNNTFEFTSNISVRILFDPYSIPDQLEIFKIASNDQSTKILNTGCVGNRKTDTTLTFYAGERIKILINGPTTCQSPGTAWELKISCGAQSQQTGNAKISENITYIKNQEGKVVFESIDTISIPDVLQKMKQLGFDKGQYLIENTVNNKKTGETIDLP
jgi:hypothetical protein